MTQFNDLKPGTAVILADGLFPESKRVREYIDHASMIICCDGATQKLLAYGREPDFIVGDMDSLSQDLKNKYADIITATEEQFTNDFTKAVYKSLEIGINEVIIIGSTGLREDHTMGNLGLLVEHGQKIKLQAISDFGTFTPVYNSMMFDSFKGQQVSVFSILGDSEITSENLKYPLNNMKLSNLWMGTLNEAISDSFALHFEKGGVIVFRSFI